MTRAQLEALAARVGAARVEADRKLDGEIWCAINGYAHVMWDGAGVVFRQADKSIGHHYADRIRPFTASLDAAASLVPDGWRFSVDNLSAAGPLALCEHWPKSGPSHMYQRGEAATPALALTAAALRARAMEAGDE